MQYRIEKDHVGDVKVPSTALYGIHSQRAKENFPDENRFHKEWYQSMGLVKKACYLTYAQFVEAVHTKYPNFKDRMIEKSIIDSLLNASDEIIEGKHFDSFIVPAISGGAGTSINMNINEIIANLALIKSNHKAGEYQFIDPIEHANIFQSTNDVVPTALKVALMFLFKELETAINNLRLKIEEIEKLHRNDLRIAYTQMQEAVPTSFGNLFSSYNDALSRDWWRVSKCFERIKVVNLGGSAVGTGITAPRFFIMEVVQQLQQLINMPVTRSENLSDTTSNLDVFVEVHAILKSHAVNLEKMVSDIRLLASDFSNPPLLHLPQKQVGSSIMPGKINPVIPEFVISASHRVYANDSVITSLSAQGCLELNAYMPIIGHSLIESIKLMIKSCQTLTLNLFAGMHLNPEIAKEKLYKSPSITTALIPYIGYNKSGELASYMKKHLVDIFEANVKLNIIDSKVLEKAISPDNLLKLGYSLSDLT
ncbi:MAG: lyase family protein [Bacteroidota bacterium]